ncbi:MAG: response regulator [Pseudomonadota bacterium]
MPETQSIIVVDDDEDIRETLEEYFSANGFNVSTAEDAVSFRSLLDQQSYALAILDLRLPGEDGLSLCRHVRETHQMGVIMLTGSADSIDRVVGLEVGADDYVAKPFDLRELLARVRSVIRRTESLAPAVEEKPKNREISERAFEFANCSVNPDGRYLLTPDGESVALSNMEFELVKAFFERPGRVLSRDILLDIAHNRDWDPYDRSIDVRITRLRKKIEKDPARPRFLKTVRGVGYLYSPDGE